MRISWILDSNESYFYFLSGLIFWITETFRIHLLCRPNSAHFGVLWINWSLAVWNISSLIVDNTINVGPDVSFRCDNHSSLFDSDIRFKLNHGSAFDRPILGCCCADCGRRIVVLLISMSFTSAIAHAMIALMMGVFVTYRCPSTIVEPLFRLVAWNGNGMDSVDDRLGSCMSICTPTAVEFAVSSSTSERSYLGREVMWRMVSIFIVYHRMSLVF